MNFLQYRETYVQKTFIGVPTPPDYQEGFTQTPTPLQSQNQSPQVSDLATAPGLTIQSPSIFDNVNAVTTSSELTADILESEEGTVSVSTAFHPTAYPQLPPVDTILSSSDGVLFYVHASTILCTCESAFREFLGSSLDNPKFRDTLIPMASTSAELNIILHMIYGMSPASYSPTLEMLVNAVDSMPAYSIIPCKHILPGTPLYNLILSHAPLHPLDVYALAAHHNIHPLAVMTSSHLLSYPLQTITDIQAKRMGAVYMKKLMILHVDRLSALKSVLLELPPPHPPTRDCDFSAQKKLTRVWSLVSASLAWDARPDMSAQSIQAALDPLFVQLDCEGCQKSLRDRIKDLIVRWTAVPFYWGFSSDNKSRRFWFSIAEVGACTSISVRIFPLNPFHTQFYNGVAFSSL